MADWVSRELAAVGIVTSYPLEEDWGWFIEHDESMICCCGRLDASKGDYEWEIYYPERSGWFLWLLRREPAPCENDLLHVIGQILDKAQIPSSIADL